MTYISHHPDELILLDFHRGRLASGQALLVRAHLEMCAHCRSTLHLFEAIGGSFLEETAPVEMAADALELAIARIERPESVSEEPRASVQPAYLSDKDLPACLRQAAFKKRYWGAPGVWMAHLDTPQKGRNLTYLMCVRGGMKMPLHGHEGMEMTLVLSGSFSDDNGVYRPGDCVVCEEGDPHSPLIAADEDCLCLIAALAPIAPKTVLGKLLQPFARI